MTEDDPWAEKAVASGLATLDLARLGETVFEGTSLPVPNGRVFGGQLLAQGLLAAGLTVPDDRHAHSLHAYFLRPGDCAKPIRFEVEILRDGRSFSARRTHALQVPGPDAAVSGVEILRKYEGHAIADFWLKDAPFDVRHVEGTLFDRVDPKPKSFQTAWMKVRGTLDVPELTHRALIAFACDQVMMEPLLRRHSVSWATRGISFASLDHAMWWHRPARADEWLLFAQDAPTAQGGRGLTGAWVFTEDGRLVASIAQEGMLRIGDDRAAPVDGLTGSS